MAIIFMPRLYLCPLEALYKCLGVAILRLDFDLIIHLLRASFVMVTVRIVIIRLGK